MADLTAAASPRLNACQEFGKLAARMHATRCVGALDMSNCNFEEDGTLVAMFSVGRARILEDDLTVRDRGDDLASLKEQLGASEWEAVKLGYRFSAGADAEEVLANADGPA